MYHIITKVKRKSIYTRTLKHVVNYVGRCEHIIVCVYIYIYISEMQHKATNTTKQAKYIHVYIYVAITGRPRLALIVSAPSRKMSTCRNVMTLRLSPLGTNEMGPKKGNDNCSSIVPASLKSRKSLGVMCATPSDATNSALCLRTSNTMFSK